jgi:hypothetical protein
MDLGDAAVLGMPQGPDQGDDVESELVLGQGETPFLLGPERYGVARTERITAAVDLETE